jgi:hypothetical protein
VGVLILAGEKDACVPLPGIRQLYQDLRGPKRFAVLVGGSHFHGHDEAQQRYEMAREAWQAVVGAKLTDPAFDLAAIVANSPEFSRLLPAEDAIATMQALCLAHMDEQLKDKAEAAAFLDHNLDATFRTRGIELQEVASEAALLPA